jgi:hypothetical protein
VLVILHKLQGFVLLEREKGKKYLRFAGKINAKPVEMAGVCPVSEGVTGRKRLHPRKRKNTPLPRSRGEMPQRHTKSGAERSGGKHIL